MIQIEEISAKKAAKLLKENPGLVVVDTRMQMEFEKGHLPNAILIDFYEADFAQQVAKLPRGSEVLLYCRSGIRTFESLTIFEKLGFKKVYHLTYGILEWKREGFPLVK